MRLVCATGLLLGTAVLVPAAAGGNRPVPIGFRATSIAAASPRTWFALGGVDCSHRNCRTLVARSDDSGRSWRLVSSPHAVSGEVAPAPDFVGSRISFINPSIGWIYGGGMWSTHDDGAHWLRAQVGENGSEYMVTGIAVIGSTVFALGEGCNTAGQMCEFGRLFESPVVRDAFRPMPGLPEFGFPGGGFYGSLTQVGRGGYLWVDSFAGKASVALDQNDGHGWTRSLWPCGVGFGVLGGATAGDPVTVCSVFRNAGPVVNAFASHDSGASWTRLAKPPPVGDPTTLAVTPDGTIFLGGDRGLIVFTRNGGRSWERLVELGGAGWSQVTFVSATTGFGLPYLSSRATHLVVTADGGRTWRRESFR